MDDNNALETTGAFSVAPGGTPYKFYGAPGYGDFVSTGSGNKIYFDAFLRGDSDATFVAPGYNKAMGLVAYEGRLMGPVTVRPVALLGYWWDCNDDGYVGNYSTGLFMYPPSETPNACENARTISTSGLDDQVYEFIAIGDLAGYDLICNGCDDDNDPTTPHPEEGGVIPCSGDADPCLNPLGEFNRADDPVVTVNDSGANVWGDWDVPDEAVPRDAIIPMPPGTLSTIGGHIKYVDWLTDHVISSFVGTANWEALTCAKDGDDPMGNPTPGYSPDSPCSTFNVQNPVGYFAREVYNNRVSNDGSSSDVDGSSAWISMNWDCNRKVDPDGQGTIVTATPGNPSHNFVLTNNPPYGSLHGQMAEIDRGLGEGSSTCDPDPEGMDAVAYDSLEGYTSTFRSKHAFSFRFVPRGYDEYNSVPGIESTGRVDLGVWGGGNYWEGREQVQTLLTRHNPYATPRMLTFYAKISEQALDRWKNPAVPAGAALGASTLTFDTAVETDEYIHPIGTVSHNIQGVVDIYGREACEDSTLDNGFDGTIYWRPYDSTPGGTWQPLLSDPMISGWDCNQAVWEWTTDNRNNDDPWTDWEHVDIGTPYSFRDIDCFDNFSGILGIYYSMAPVFVGDCYGGGI